MLRPIAARVEHAWRGRLPDRAWTSGRSSSIVVDSVPRLVHDARGAFNHSLGGRQHGIGFSCWLSHSGLRLSHVLVTTDGTSTLRPYQHHAQGFSISKPQVRQPWSSDKNWWIYSVFLDTMCNVLYASPHPFVRYHASLPNQVTSSLSSTLSARRSRYSRSPSRLSSIQISSTLIIHVYSASLSQHQPPSSPNPRLNDSSSQTSSQSPPH